MSLPIRRLLQCGHLPRTRYPVHAKARRALNSTRRLKDAPIPTLKAEIVVPKADGDDSDPYGSFKTREEPALLRPIIFTLTVGFCTFAGAAYLTRQDSEELAWKNTKSNASVGHLRYERIMLEVAQAHKTLDWLRERGVPEPIPWCYAWLATHWINYSDGQRVGVSLVAANAMVFLAWQIPVPAMRFFMVKHFMHHPLSGRSYTLLTSVFSHMVSYYYRFTSCSKGH